VPLGAHLAVTGALAWASGGLVARVAAPGATSLADLLGVAAAAGAWVVATWLAAGVTLCVLARLRGGRLLTRLSRRLAGPAARRTAAALLGAGLAGLPVWAAPAHAGRPAPVGASAPGPTSDDERPGVPAGWTPDRPAAPRPAGRERATVVRAAVVRAVVVRPGDTLWGIAAAHLPGDPTTAGVAAAWPRWYAANRREIGPDPDLLLPGQRLRPPG
jgi:nucleoid-associated protein YgaU